MVAELLEVGPDDGEEVMIAWLLPLRPRATNNDRGVDDELPATLVTAVAGAESEAESWSDPVLSVHTLCDRDLGDAAARVEAQDTHKRILLLARTLEDVVLVDGRSASIDYVRVIEPPRRVEWGDDRVIRRVGRYQIGLAYD